MTVSALRKYRREDGLFNPSGPLCYTPAPRPLISRPRVSRSYGDDSLDVEAPAGGNSSFPGGEGPAGLSLRSAKLRLQTLGEILVTLGFLTDAASAALLSPFAAFSNPLGSVRALAA